MTQGKHKSLNVRITDEEKKELEQEYENLKLLASFHEAYGVPENAKEREALINDILDRMNEIQEKLKKL